MSSGDENADGSVGEVDERLKKKQQNSVRWKRWWMKNREAYNEKRRLSAQIRSAKIKAEKAKVNGQSVSHQAPAPKRTRLDPTETRPSLESLEAFELIQPTISPLQSSRSSLSVPIPYPASLTAPQQYMVRPAPTMALPQISQFLNMKPGFLPQQQFYPAMIPQGYVFPSASFPSFAPRGLIPQ